MDERSPVSQALLRQKAIYTAGVAGIKPIIPLSYPRLVQQAKLRLSKRAFDYIDCGAGSESTIWTNSSDFDKYRIVPRMLNDVGTREINTSYLGLQLSAPILLAPVGVLELAHKTADIGVSKAAHKTQTAMIFSNQASVSMEETAASMPGGDYFFQLYFSKSRELVKSFVQRAERCGCKGIVVTLDTTMLGWRTRDLDNAYLPFLEGMGLAQYVSDPVFNAMLDDPEVQHSLDSSPPKITTKAVMAFMKLNQRYPGSTWSHFKTKRPIKAVRLFINTYTNPSLSWDDLAFLRDTTQLPIILKGILHPDDASKAKANGFDGIVVSNHGGRQVDGAVSTVHQLPAIRKAVGDRYPILMDSGIRTGAEIFKAICLGADAICVGRPYVYALALKGQAGVEHYIQNLKADLELTMALAGTKSIEEIKATKLEVV
jgi:lactate 2-monooxygenase